MRAKWPSKLVSLLVALLLLTLAACGAQSTTRQPTPSATSVPASRQDDVPPPTPTASPTTPSTPLPTPTQPPAPTPTPAPPSAPAAPLGVGRVILVSLSRQQLYAYQDGALAFTFTVETGRPELPTPTGVYHIFLKNCSDLRWTNNDAPTSSHNVNCVQHNGDGFQEMFSSPWPPGSPNWYAPTHINYAMEFREGGFYMHDAWWHVAFGPGSNVPHQLPDGTWETGSHGCIGMRIPDAERLYSWAPLGTPVYVRATT